MSKRLSNLHNKILSWEDALRARNVWALKGEKVAFTNGCFDILHLGHVSYLAQAADTAQRLIVAINTDASVRALDKAPNRPINPEIARAVVLASLSFVDAVVYFEQDTPVEIIEQLKPDILLKGADYNADQTNPQAKDYIVGSDFVRSYGGNVQTIPFVDGYSTTGILAKGKF
ncbi:MAG: adenylyltransferase/cytidyltransferase family protein [Flavobacteriales bacterium]